MVAARCYDCKRVQDVDRMVARGACKWCGGRRLSPTNPTLREKILILLGIR